MKEESEEAVKWPRLEWVVEHWKNANTLQAADVQKLHTLTDEFLHNRQLFAMCCDHVWGVLSKQTKTAASNRFHLFEGSPFYSSTFILANKLSRIRASVIQLLIRCYRKYLKKLLSNCLLCRLSLVDVGRRGECLANRANEMGQDWRGFAIADHLCKRNNAPLRSTAIEE